MASARSLRTEQLLPAAVACTLAAEAAAIVSAYARQPSRAVLLVALGCDAVLLPAMALAFLARRAGGWRALGISGRALVRAVAIGGVLAGVAARAAGAPVGALFFGVVAAAELTLVGMIALAIARGLSSFRSDPDAAWSALSARLSRVVPPVAAEAALSEIRLLGAAARAIARRPLRPLAGERYSALRTSQSGFIVPLAVILTCVEMPAVHAALFAWLGGGHWGVHAAEIGLNAYGILWIAGDRRLMQESAHRLTARGLELSLGLRWRGEIPYSAMRDVIRLDPGKRPPPDALTRAVTPYDAPNVHLCLARPVEIAKYFGLRRKVQHLDFYLDDPDAFVDALVRHCRDAARARAAWLA